MVCSLWHDAVAPGTVRAAEDVHEVVVPFKVEVRRPCADDVALRNKQVPALVMKAENKTIYNVHSSILKSFYVVFMFYFS